MLCFELRGIQISCCIFFIIMMSFTGGIKSLSTLAEHLFKSEALYFGFSGTFRRTLVIKSILFNRSKLKKIAKLEYRKPFQASENLGEIVDLNVEFDEVKIDNKNIKSKRKINKENLNLKNNVEVGSSFRNTEMNDNTHVQKENNLEESKKNSALKRRQNDIILNSKILSLNVINLRTSKSRKVNQEIILEGKRLINDAISAGFYPSKVFFSRTLDVEKLDLPENTLLYKVPYKSLKLWGDVVTPQGVLAIFKIPEINSFKNNANSIPLTIICDNIRDPGNLGSILRIAAGVGCEKLILIKGCSDIWESKVLRAGAGAHFRLPILNNFQWSDVKDKISENSKIVLADLDDHITFNTASENKDDPKNKTRSEISESLPTQCYYSVKYGKESAVIIIGGETHGISDEAYKFGIERKGIRVFIPMNNEIESLNTSVALGILAYEFKRQFDSFCGKEIPLQVVNSNIPKSEAC